MNSLTSVFAKSAASLGSGDSYITSSKRELPDARTVRLRCARRINSSFFATCEVFDHSNIRCTRDAKPRQPVAGRSWSRCNLSITRSSRDSLCRILACVSTYDSGEA